MEFLHSFLRCHFTWKPVVALFSQAKFPADLKFQSFSDHALCSGSRVFSFSPLMCLENDDKMSRHFKAFALSSLEVG